MTNFDFVKVSTLPLYIWEDIIVDFDTHTEYGAYVISEVEAIQRLIGLGKYGLHTLN